MLWLQPLAAGGAGAGRRIGCGWKGRLEPAYPQLFNFNFDPQPLVEAKQLRPGDNPQKSGQRRAGPGLKQAVAYKPRWHKNRKSGAKRLWPAGNPKNRGKARPATGSMQTCIELRAVESVVNGDGPSDLHSMGFYHGLSEEPKFLASGYVA